MTLAIALLGVGFFFGDNYINSLAKTEQRAKNNMEKFVSENGIAYARAGCAGDSDKDGFGSCQITPDEGDTIYLQCPARWWDVAVLGAQGCKEVSGRSSGAGSVVVN